MDMNTNKQRNPSIELLRIICMLMIVLYHCQYMAIISTTLSKAVTYTLTSWGILGVDIFVVIFSWYYPDFVAKWGGTGNVQ